MLQISVISLELLNLLPGGVSHRVPARSLLASLDELLGPRIEGVGLDPFAPAEFVDRVLAAKTSQDDSDLLLRTVLASRCRSDLADKPLGTSRSLLSFF